MIGSKVALHGIIAELITPYSSYGGIDTGGVGGLVERGVAGGSLREDADQEALTAMLLLLLPHIALAPHREGLDPVLGLGSPAAVVRREAVERVVDVLRRAFGAPA